MSDLFDRLNDLKVVFKYGQKLIPIIQGIIDFMKETVPLLEDINTSIADSTSKIPKAKDQIDNVSSATELATTEILDIVDSVSNDITILEEDIRKNRERETEKEKLWLQIKAILSAAGNNDGLIQQYEALGKSADSDQDILKTLGEVKNNVYNITLSLQVQDITSQQLAAVNHLIESVRTKLASLILHLDESDVSGLEVDGIEVPENAAFDPDAYYSKSTERQDMADDIIKDSQARTSQDEIDKLFS